MSVTVKQIASSELFKKDIPLLAGESGLNYEVKYVTICNSPVLSIPNYNLDDSVFVLTSFSPYYGSVERMIEMVYFLERQNISALCVKLDSYLGQMPKEIIAVCNDIGLPLFAFNDSGIPFRKVIFEIDKEIIGGNIAALEQSNQQYAMLYDNIMSGENVDTCLKNLSNTLHCGVMAVSCNAKLLGYCAGSGEAEDSSDGQLRFAERLISSMGQNKRVRESGMDGQLVEGRWVFPCRVHGNIEGFLILTDDRLDIETCRKAIENTVTFISVKLLESMMLSQSMLKENYHTIESLFYKNQNEEVVRHRLMLMGISSAETFRIIGFACANPGGRSYLELQQKWSWINAVLSKLFLQSVICFSADDMFTAVIFYNSSSKYNNDSVMRDTLSSVAREHIRDASVKCAFSNNITRYSEFPQAFSDLRKTLKYAFVFAGDKQVCAHNDMEQAELVAAIMHTPEYSHVRHSIIQPIREYDRLYKSELWDSLRVCLEYDNLGDAANALFIHKSTLRYRLQKINTLTGQNYFTSTGKFMLQLAAIAHQLETS